MTQSSEGLFGTLLFVRKDGRPGNSYSLTIGETTIGASKDAVIRLKLIDNRLEQIHCIIDVSNNGIATLLNKSLVAPVKVNNVFVRKIKVLNHNDTIELCGKKIQYLNENVSEKDVLKYQIISNEVSSTPSNRRSAIPLLTRRSVTPLLAVNNIRGIPNLRTKTPRKRRASTRNSFAGSKVVVSKALHSPGSYKSRRFSLDMNPKDLGRGPKISARNILLSEVVSSTTPEESTVSSKPSISVDNSDSSIIEDHKEYLVNSEIAQEALAPQSDVDPKKRHSSRISRKSIKINFVDEIPEKMPRDITPTNKTFASLKRTPSSHKFLSVSSPRNVSTRKANKSLNLTENQDTENLTTPTINNKLTHISMFSPISPMSTGGYIKTITPNLTETLEPSLRRICSARKSRSITKDRKSYVNGKLVASSTASRKSLNKTEENIVERHSLGRHTAKNLEFASHGRASGDRMKTLASAPNDDASFEDSFSLELESTFLNISLTISEQSVRNSSKTRPSRNWPNKEEYVSESEAMNTSTSTSNNEHYSSSDNSFLQEDQADENEAGSLSSSKESLPISESRSLPHMSRSRSRQSLRKSRISAEEFLTVPRAKSLNTFVTSRNASRSGVVVENKDYDVLSASTDLPKKRASLLVNPSKPKTPVSATLVGRRSSRSSKVNSKLTEENEISKGQNSLRKTSARYSTVMASAMDQDLGNAERRSSRNSRGNSRLAEDSLLNSFNSHIFELEHNQIVQDRNSKSRSTPRYSPTRAFGMDEDSENLSGSHSLRSSRVINSKRAEESLLNSPALELLEHDLSKDRNSIRKPSRYSITGANTMDEVLGKSSSSSETLTGRRSSRHSRGQNSNISEKSLLNPPVEELEQNKISKDRNSLRKSSARYSLTKVNTVDDDLENSSSDENAAMGDTLIGRHSSRSSRGKNSNLSEKSLLNTPVFELEQNEMYKDRNSSARYSLTKVNKVDEDLENLSHKNAGMGETVTGRRFSRSSRVNSNLSEVSLHSPIFKLERNELNNSQRSSKRLLAKKSNIAASACKSLIKQDNISIITLNDSIDGTPENNTSIIYIDSPFDKIGKSPKRPSKTMNSTIHDDIELTTPKSAIRSRRSKSLPYNPLTEEITPVTPINMGAKDGGFKTPLNTPGLFEKIKKTVTRSRSGMQSNLMDELNKEEAKNGAKRLRESGGSSAKPNKKRKILESCDSILETDDVADKSFDSFTTGSALSDISDQFIYHNTPKYFSDLTDKPVFTNPEKRSLTEPKKKRSGHLRRSLHAMRLESQLSSGNESVRGSDIISTSFDSSESTDVNIGNRRSLRRSSIRDQDVENSSHKRVQKTPSSDIRDVTTLKKFRRTPKDMSSPVNDVMRDQEDVEENSSHIRVQKTPSNDLSDVAGLKKLLKTPKDMRSPINDLSDVRGVKQLFQRQASPKNDLSKVPNLEKYMYPKTVKSPENDLTNVAGVKKMLSTPKEFKSPKNDLRHINSLRNFFSPKKENSPRNDLSDVTGVKNLLSTPKDIRSPKNDLRNIPNLRKLMSPKKPNSPRNDLTNVSGVGNIFEATVDKNLGSENDTENENSFDKLFANKPLKTYRGKSSSPIGKNVLPLNQTGTPSGDAPYTSPRVEEWIETQAVMNFIEPNANEGYSDTRSHVERKSKRRDLKETVIENDSSRAVRRGRNKRTVANDENSDLISDNIENLADRNYGKRKAETDSDNDSEVSFGKRKPSKEDICDDQMIEQIPESCQVKLPTAKLGRQRKIPQPIVTADQIPEVHSTTEEVKSSVSTRGRGKRIMRNVKDTNVEISPPIKQSGRTNNICAEAGSTDNTPQENDEGNDIIPIKRTRRKDVKATHQTSDVATEVPLKRGRGKPKATKGEESKSTLKTDATEEVPVKRGRGKPKATKGEESQSTLKTDPTEEVPIKRGRGRPKGTKAEESQSTLKTDGTQRSDDAPQHPPSKRITRKNALEVEVIQNESEEVTKKTSRSRKNAADHRESEVDEEVEDVAHKTVKPKRKQAVTKSSTSDRPLKDIQNKTKVKVLEELNVSVDSPRTIRAKRGNFNKYGDDFLTDDSMREERKAVKKVHFDDSNSKFSPEKKRKGRNMEKTEIQEPIRRSKRTRK